MTEAFVNCPFEVVKVRMQAKENVKPTIPTFCLFFVQSDSFSKKLNLYKNSFSALTGTIQKEGVLALYKGLEAQLWRKSASLF